MGGVRMVKVAMAFTPGWLVGQFRTALTSILLVFWVVAGITAPAQSRDAIVIGISQFPSTMHPNIDSMLAKSYVGYMTRRPFTTYDHDWNLVCMLCTELPTFENGKAVAYDLPDGGQGVKLTFTIQPGATWGDGIPLTTEDVVFTWEVGREPLAGVSNFELYKRIEK
ncbi:MAG: hypothetical protein AAF220_14900, partial [Pseudomonadota bacterium]